jgi:hypothetical protein
VRFAVARVLLIADGDNTEGVKELQSAVSDGFNDITAVEKLLNYRISAANKTGIQEVINNMKKTAVEEEQKKEAADGDSSLETES